MPCRGTGRVISNLGGTPSEVTCPWCEGGGIRLPGHDAQARWPAGGDGGAEATQPQRAAEGAGRSETPAPEHDPAGSTQDASPEPARPSSA
jgi:hypothetical protein